MIENQEFTYIGKNSKITGTFHFQGATHLKGHLIGEIKIEGFAKLVLEINSMTEGKLHCHDLDIYGDFTGEIYSTGLVTIYPTGFFEGKILAQSIEILPGAVVNMNGHTEESSIQN